MTTLHIFLLVLFIFLCFLLIGAVLLQSGKGGGMAGLGGGNSDTAFGAHTANVLQKFTMFCVIGFFVLVIVLAHTLQNNKKDNTSLMEGYTPEKIEVPSVETKKEESAPVENSSSQAMESPVLNSEPAKTPVETKEDK